MAHHEFPPVATIADVLLLDMHDVDLGYWHGYAGNPEPGMFVSRSFWHGWRTGAWDAGVRPPDPDQVALAAAFDLAAGHKPETTIYQ